jgi:hypothetical protein
MTSDCTSDPASTVPKKCTARSRTAAAAPGWRPPRPRPAPSRTSTPASREAAAGGESNGDGQVEVRAGDVADGVHHHHDCEARRLPTPPGRTTPTARRRCSKSATDNKDRPTPQRQSPATCPPRTPLGGATRRPAPQPQETGHRHHRRTKTQRDPKGIDPEAPGADPVSPGAVTPQVFN